jgi:hypothetical protein
MRIFLFPIHVLQTSVPPLSASFHQKGVLLLFLLVSAIVLFRIASAERARFEFGCRSQ